jgi:hypothetical protein
MAHFWVLDANDAWTVSPLDGDRVAIDGAGRAFALRVTRAAAGEEWVLVAEPLAVVVNGRPLLTGLHVLGDRDDVRLPGSPPRFFSAERLSAVEPLPEGPAPLACPRCRQTIAAGTPSVRCPQCQVWHHETSDLPCWTYAETCALCDQVTAMDSGYRWTPHGL